MNSEKNIMKNFLIVIVVIAVLVGGFFALNSYIYNEKQGEGLPQNFRDVAFRISDEPITLQDGVVQARTALGGDSLTTIRYFGNELVHDIDGDGTEDTVFLITQETVEGNMFFYAVGAIQRDEGYTGTHAVYLGDHIAPQTTEKGADRQIIVNYMDRAPGEPMTTPPSVGRSLRLLLDTETLAFGEVVQDFEGEER